MLPFRPKGICEPPSRDARELRLKRISCANVASAERFFGVCIILARSFISALPFSMSPTIETREEVMFFDTDIGGVVHNIAYLRMIETCRTRLAALLGMKLREMSQTQIYPVVVRTEIDYRKPATLGDELVIKGWLDQVERARFWCAFEIRRAGEDTILIRCRQSLALVKMPEGRPLRLPEEWGERYAHLHPNAGAT
jgi:4-hydroxybenzoyl-CoA thioesterase/acyl-CoA thioester hydrolase